MTSRDTLRIKNLPKELSESQKEDFLKHFGAVHVKVVTSRAKEKATVYARFETSEVAKHVMYRLHQITVLNSRLCVEYAQNSILQGKTSLKKADNSGKKFFRTFLNKINAFNDSAGFHQPPPSHLKYNYPKANRATINNIAHALATVPRFYTQVLHLMNKMNLPPPFAMPEPPVRTITPGQHPIAVQKPAEKRKNSSSESEMESDEESQQNKDIIPQKRTLPEKKVIKRPKFIKIPTTQGNVIKITKPMDSVFEKVEVVAPKKIELKVVSASLEPKAEQNVQELEKKAEPEAPSSPDDDKPCISLEELSANQITDLTALPVFKNYQPGVPTNKLYIKNCAKTVILQDLEYIYNRYREEGTEDKPSQFNIRLMQEGRMKGQAFVTLDSAEIAQKAVKETNGFILKDKPLVVVFAKSAQKK